MTLLGLDTSAIACTAALTRDGEVLAAFSRRDGLTHSETLLPGIEELFRQRGMTEKDLDAIAVSAGPGSFTGLRIGISTVKGLAYAADLPCIPVSTREALAENAVSREGALVCAVMDARRGEFYNALFRVKNGVTERLTPDRAVTGKALAEELTGQEKLVLLGDGAEKFGNLFPDFAEYLAPEKERFQSGVSVCRVGERLWIQGGAGSCRTIAPRYLRLPQAEREWIAKQKTK